MNLKRMILHAMLPALMLGVFSLLAAPASAIVSPTALVLRTVPATLIHRSFSVCWATSM